MRTERVHVAVFDSWADWELGYAIAHIRRTSWQRSPGRYEVVTVGLTAEPITTMGGLRITPDTTLDEVEPTDSAMLLLAGGDTWADEVMQPFRDLARRFVEAGVPVAALCGATFGLALAGLLDERPHTSNDPGYLAMSGYAGGAHYRAEPAVSDGTVITGSGTRPVPFARAVLDRLAVYEPGVLASWYKLYNDDDPAGFYELMSA